MSCLAGGSLASTQQALSQHLSMRWGTVKARGVPGPSPGPWIRWSQSRSCAHLPPSWGFRWKLSFLIGLIDDLLPLPHATQRVGEIGGCHFLFLGEKKLFLRPGRVRLRQKTGQRWDGDRLRHEDGRWKEGGVRGWAGESVGAAPGSGLVLRPRTGLGMKLRTEMVLGELGWCERAGSELPLAVG